MDAETVVTSPSNEELAGTANQLLEKVLQYLENAEAFGAEQMPHLVQEVLTYETLMAGMGVFLCFFGMIWGAFTYRWSRRNADARLERMAEHEQLLKDTAQEQERPTKDVEDCVFTFPHYAVPISGVISTVFGFFLMFKYLPELIKITTAPRLFLLEYFRALI